MMDRAAQIESIRSELVLPVGHTVRYEGNSDTIVLGCPTLSVTFEAEHLDRDDYLDLVKISFGRLLQAIDMYMATVEPMGNA